MERFILVLCGWLLPLFVFADVAPEVTLRLVEGTYRPGDVIELQAEMRGADYAEFELHVPANRQLHCVANSREPVRYVEGEYVQRALLLLQPMSAGDFELNGMTATIVQGGVATDVALSSLQFTVASYAAEDTSDAIAELGADATSGAEMSAIKRTVIWVLFIILMVVWLRLKVANSKSVETAEAEVGLSDLIVKLEAGESATALIEVLLVRPSLSLSPNLRAHLESAVYANRMDAEELLELLRKEVAR